MNSVIAKFYSYGIIQKPVPARADQSNNERASYLQTAGRAPQRVGHCVLHFATHDCVSFRAFYVRVFERVLFRCVERQVYVVC